ncbi:MAG: hypothetical protein ACOCWM_05935 [Cyclobacteriaceae bacterium]
MKEIFKIFVLIVLFSLFNCSPKDFPQAEMIKIETDLIDYIDSLAFTSQDSNQYIQPDAQEILDFRNSVRHCLDNIKDQCLSSLSQLDYSLVELTDSGNNDKKYLGLIGNKLKGRGAYFINIDATNNYVISAPHSHFETNTDIQSGLIFRGCNAKYLAISTSHRCSNTEYSSCSGTTSVCGSTDPHRISDSAHNINSYFQIFHEEVYNHSNTTVFQLHGFSYDSGDPSVIVSNGTNIDLDATSIVNLFATNLENLLNDASVGAYCNSCNEIGDPDYLCGTTNIQGRFINGLSHDDACNIYAPTSSNKFFHIEQSYDLRTESGNLNPNILISAIKITF